MENLSVLTNFPEAIASYYKTLDPGGLPESYSLCSGGTFYFFSNNRGRTIRFTENDLMPDDITSATITAWLNKIHQYYPTF